MWKQYVGDLKKEFKGYDSNRLTKDLMAGLTVAAVALPLALAFGVSSGADAAAGLITAIIGGLIIGGLSGASYQISGPTGAMTAVLVSIVYEYGMQGVFLATFMAGTLLLLSGVFKLGKLVGLIPSPVITGFTSGIAIIIVLGQVDNFFGVISEGSSNLEKLASYSNLGFLPDLPTVSLGVLVVLCMILWPKKWNAKIPSSLVGIILALGISTIFQLDVAVVGEIPKTLLPQTRLSFKTLSFSDVSGLISPAFAIAALGMIESLLCGAAAGRMKGEKLNADRELVAQGIGNMLIPFFGGVPATAAIARTSVAIKSGEETRLTSIFHALGLLASMFLLGGVMSRIPLSALAGVLVVTAWRMNEWESIRFMFKKRLKTALAQFMITMVATVVFDLTMAILIGIMVSLLLFIIRISDMGIELSDIDKKRLEEKQIDVQYAHEKTKVIYLTGPVFFPTVDKIQQEMDKLEHELEYIIFSMRGVPLIDTTGTQFLEEVCKEFKGRGTKVIFSGVQPQVMSLMTRSGLVEQVGEKCFFWSVDHGLKAIDHQKLYA